MVTRASDGSGKREAVEESGRRCVCVCVTEREGGRERDIYIYRE